MKAAPVALFVYNRPYHTRQTIDFLQKNELAKQTALHIYSDGAKNDEDEIKVKEVRNFLKNIDGFFSVKIIERNENYGLAKSIINGVTDILNKNDKIIVLEDDLLTSPYFLRYMNEALEFYENENEVISIHGYVYPVHTKLPETFFIKGADCWGWATWKRGWKIFEKDGVKLLNELKEKHLLSKFDFDDTYFFTGMLEDQIAGKNNSWAIRWNASAFLSNKLTLYPGHTLVQNIGNDNSGVHSGANNFFDVTLYNHPIKLDDINIQESAQGYKAFADYFRSINPPNRSKQSFIKKILRKFK